MNSRFSKKGLVAIAVLLVVVLFVAFLIWVIFLWPSAAAPTRDVLPEVREQTLTPTELSVLLTSFDPWHSPRIDDMGTPVTNKKALVLLQENGGMRVSSWGIRMEDMDPEKGYGIIFTPPEITAITINGGMVTIQTNKGRQFVIAVEQPFILEQTPASVYKIVGSGAFRGFIVPIGTKYAAQELRYKLE